MPTTYVDEFSDTFSDRFGATVTTSIERSAARWSFVVGDEGREERELTAASARKLTFRRSEAASASLSINGHHAEAALISELITDLHVYRDGVKIFRGRCGPTSDDVQPTEHRVEFSFGDYRARLDRRILFSTDVLVYNGYDAGDLALALVDLVQARTGGDDGITAGVGIPAGIDAPDMTYQAGQSIEDAISSFATADGSLFDWEVDAELRLNVYPNRRGSANGVVLDYGGMVQSVKRTVDPGQYANDVRYSGAAGLERRATAADIATRAEGRWEMQVGDQDVTSGTLLTNRARKKLDDAQTIRPAYVARLAPGRWQGPGHVWLGDLVKLAVRSGRLDVVTTLIVEEVSVEVLDTGDEVVDVTLGSTFRGFAKRLAKAERRLLDLERT